MQCAPKPAHGDKLTFATRYVTSSSYNFSIVPRYKLFVWCGLGAVECSDQRRVCGQRLLQRPPSAHGHGHHHMGRERLPARPCSATRRPRGTSLCTGAGHARPSVAPSVCRSAGKAADDVDEACLHSAVQRAGPGAGSASHVAHLGMPGPVAPPRPSSDRARPRRAAAQGRVHATQTAPKATRVVRAGRIQRSRA